MLELEAVSRAIGGQFLLEQASFCFHKDAPGVVLGLSADGRKAFLRLLSGADRPEAGKITLDGAALKRGAKHYVWISRNGAAPSGASVRKTLKAAGAKTSGAAEALVKRVGLAGKGETRVRDLDAGQRVRLAIACWDGGEARRCC